MKRKFLTTALASTLVMSNLASGMALEDIPLIEEPSEVIQNTIDLDQPYGEVTESPFAHIKRGAKPEINFNDLKPKTGKQKVLCIMVEFENDKIMRGRNEKTYSEMLFGKSYSSLKSYLRDQSDGRMKIYPAEVKGAKAPGVIKVKLRAADYGTVASRDYDVHDQIAYDAIRKVWDKIEWEKLDINGDKQFKEAFLTDNDSLQEELLFTFVLAGRAEGKKYSNPGHVTSWTHLTKLNTHINGYDIKNSAIITSELASRPVTSADFAHEFLHNLNARDMYLDLKSVGPWSVMCKDRGRIKGHDEYIPTPLDPVHKIYFKWAKPVKLNPVPGKTIAIKFNKRQVPYLVDPKDPNIIYLLDYKDRNNLYVRGLNRYDYKGQNGLVVWKINKSLAEKEWLYDKNGKYDWYVNSYGARTSMTVMCREPRFMSFRDSFIVEGKARSIDGTLFKVHTRGKNIYVSHRGK